MPPLLTIAVYGRKPAWALEERYVEAVRRAAGDAFEVFQAASDEELTSRLAETEVMYGLRLTSDNFRLAEKLKWVQSTSAGVDGALFAALVESGVMVTNSSGIHAIQISEHALAMMLMLTRRFPWYLRRQLKKEWDKGAAGEELGELYGRTLGIVGLGAIGEALAARAKAFGMRVIGAKKSPLGYSGAADEVVGAGAMERIFAESDYVVNLLPLTSETAGVISMEMIAAMKPTAYFLSLGRGATVDEGALAAALEYGKIAGAGLDVFAEEPLPKRSPLWKMGNVIITPHVAGSTPDYWRRATDLFCGNLRLYAAGGQLMNVVDKEIGY